MIRARHYSNDVIGLWTDNLGKTPVTELCDAVVNECAASEVAGILVFFSQNDVCGQSLVSGIAQALISHSLFSPADLYDPIPSLVICGCSTSGEVTPDGFTNSSTLIMLLPKIHFTLSAMYIDQVSNRGMDDIADCARNHLQQFNQELTPNPDHVFSMLFIDGLTYSEEAVTSALHRGLGDIPIIGGSAGDDLQFKGTVQLLQDCAHTNSAVVVLLECRIPFLLFNEHNLIPTENKLVVTDAEPDRRLVREFNAEPAAVAYARAIGQEPENLTAMSFASHTVVVRVGGEYHCRAIRKVNPDFSLSFYCAIDNGLVLTVARSIGMVRSTRDAINRFEHHLGSISMMIGFDCIYRRLDAQHRNATERIENLYTNKNFIGFNSYGEQYHSMHVNQTFTGVAFGPATSSKKSIAKRQSDE